MYKDNVNDWVHKRVKKQQLKSTVLPRYAFNIHNVETVRNSFVKQKYLTFQ